MARLKKQPTKKSNGTSLHKELINSLSSLIKFWQKKSKQLEKEFYALETQLQKGIKKGTLSSKQIELLNKKILKLKNHHNQAELSFNKYQNFYQIMEQDSLPFSSSDFVKGTANSEKEVASASIEMEDAHELETFSSFEEDLSELEILEDFSTNFFEEDDTFDEDYARY